jgi:hypothetical protein
VGACNNPFFESNGTTPVVATDDPLRTPFGNHSFCGFTGLILDACAGPPTGNEDKTQYCATSIDANPELYSEGDRPGNASNITTLGGVTSLE